MLNTIRRKQLIKSDIGSVWDFISSPQNLGKITPPFMGFEILGNDDGFEKMYEGQIIEYRVSPFAFIRMNWVTEITHVSDNEYFVDEQRSGPYSLWHHQHFLKNVAGDVEMTDIVHYKIPFGIFGKLINTLFIRHQLKKIFDYRYRKMEEIFNGD